MYQYEKSRKAQLHEKSFSWFEGIGGAGRPVDVCSARTDVGRILRTFKIKKNVEVTDNGKIII